MSPGQSSSETLSKVETKMRAKAAEKKKKGKYEKALFFLEHVLTTRKFQYGPGHQLVNEIHTEIADILNLLGRNTEAQNHLLSAKNDFFGLDKGKTRTLEFDFNEYVEPVAKYISHTESLHESRKAEEKTTNGLRAQNEKLLLDLKKKLSSRELLYGKGHRLVKEVHLEIANTLTILGRENEAGFHHEALAKSKVDSTESSRQIREILTETERLEQFSLSKTEKVSPSTLKLCFAADVSSHDLLKQNRSKRATNGTVQCPNDKSICGKKLVTGSFISLMKNEYTS